LVTLLTAYILMNKMRPTEAKVDTKPPPAQPSLDITPEVLDFVYGQAQDSFGAKMKRESWAVGATRARLMYGLFKQVDMGDAPATNPKGKTKVKEYQAWCD